MGVSPPMMTFDARSLSFLTSGSRVSQKLMVCIAAWQGMAGVSLLCFPWGVSDVALQTRKKIKIAGASLALSL